MTLAPPILRAACLAAVLAAPVAAQRAPLFAGLRVPLGDAPGGAAFADLDGDGPPELLVSLPALDVVRVLVPSPVGYRWDGAEVAVGDAPRGLLLEDLDGDGAADLVSTDSGGAALTLALGLGDGSFAPATSLAVDAAPNGVAAGDLDRDGVLDLVASCGAGSASVLLGLGGGAFAPAVSVPLPGAASRPALARLDGDTVLDLAVIAAGSVQVLLGDGAGGFTAQAAVSGPSSLQAYAVADLDGDGPADLVLAGCTSTLHRGAGDGTFAPPEALTSGNCVFGPGNPSVIARDWSADGVPDLVLTNLAGFELALLRGLGDGSFDTAATSVAFGDPIVFGRAALDLAADADAFGDGTTGLAILMPGSDELALFRVPPSGDLGSAPYSALGASPAALALGDFDADGDLDVFTGSRSFLQFAGTGQLHRGVGDGTLEPAVPFAGTDEWQEALAGRFDDDAFDDLVMTRFDDFLFDTRLTVFYGDGAGGFRGDATASFGDVCGGLQGADLDGDGLTDWVIDRPGDGLVSLLMDGVGGIHPYVPLGLSGSYALGSLDGDAVPSLFLVVPGGVAIHPGLGDGTFGAPSSTVAMPVTPLRVILADLTGDGLDDLVAGLGDDGVAVLPGLSGGGVGPPLVTDFGGRAAGLQAADIDGDGRADLLATDSSDVAHVLLGDGAGGFPAVYRIGRGQSAGPTRLGDLDGDGLPELITFHLGSPAELLVIANGPGLPWYGLHEGLAGGRGVPRLAGEGDLVVGDEVSLALRDAHPGALVGVALGLSEADLPFFGGTLVPALDVLRVFVTDTAGTLRLAAHWPPGVASGTDLWWQAWIPDDGAVQGVAASNALRSRTP